MTTLEKRLEYWNKGLNDTDIAKLQDVTCGAIKQWRGKRGLAANENRGGARNPWGRAGKG